MLTKFLSVLRGKSFFQRMVAFFGAFGIIASAMLTVTQLVNSFRDNEDKSTTPQVIAKDEASVSTIQGKQSSHGHDNKNTWINVKKEKTTVYQGDTIIQGNQSSIGNRNNNTWNNNKNDKTSDDNR